MYDCLILQATQAYDELTRRKLHVADPHIESGHWAGALGPFRLTAFLRDAHIAEGALGVRALSGVDGDSLDRRQARSWSHAVQQVCLPGGMPAQGIHTVHRGAELGIR